MCPAGRVCGEESQRWISFEGGGGGFPLRRISNFGGDFFLGGSGGVKRIRRGNLRSFMMDW